MIQTRLIPLLLLKDKGLVKGQGFKNHTYVGDPLNTIRIFNRKEADEIILLDIDASNQKRAIAVEWVETLSKECTMPFGVGGGIESLEDARKLLRAGAEKICIGTSVFLNPKLITQISSEFGSQSLVVSIDCKQKNGHYEVFVKNGSLATFQTPTQLAKECERLGAGEILLTSIDHEGKRGGYDLRLIREVSNEVSIPVIASGGAGSLEHLASAVQNGADAVAAGSLFVFQGIRRAVLINYPGEEGRKAIEELRMGSSH